MKNVVFEKDDELFRLFRRYGEHQRAQLLQDLAYLKFFAPSVGTGYFVEVGVGDGSHLSNTYLFEKEFGWDGLLIEPNPEFHSAIGLSRAALLDKRAAFSREGSVGFTLCGELSTLAAVENSDRHSRRGKEILVPSTTLSRILEDSGAPDRIDYLSIDTEGTELDVLEGLDFRRYVARFVTVEHNYVEPKRSRIRQFMEAQGYRCVSGPAALWDDWFVCDH